MSLVVSCHEFIRHTPCSVSFLGDTSEDVIEAAVEHAHAGHSEEDTPTLRQAIRERMKAAIMVPGAA